MNNMEKEAKGWVCPKCGRVWAPWVKECTCSEYNETKIGGINVQMITDSNICSTSCENVYNTHKKPYIKYK